LRQSLRASLSEKLRPYPAARETLKKVYHRVAYAVGSARKLRGLVRRNGKNGTAGFLVPDELGRDPQVYRDNAIARAQDHCHYQYSSRCDACDVKAICDGFHGDYASLFSSDEARPIRVGRTVSDPLHYINDQVKIYEAEEASRPFTRTESLASKRATPPRSGAVGA
jgi:hypothetical protein